VCVRYAQTGLRSGLGVGNSRPDVLRAQIHGTSSGETIIHLQCEMGYLEVLAETTDCCSARYRTNKVEEPLPFNMQVALIRTVCATARRPLNPLLSST